LQAVILAGGLGKRLRPLTDNVPKPMIVVGGIPILERQILWLRKYGVDEIILCVGYKKESIMSYFRDGRDYKVRIRYSFEEDPLGTGGALKKVKEFTRGQDFLFTYGDIMTNLNLDPLTETLDSDYLASMAAIPLRSPFGIVEMDGDKIKIFREKPILHDYWMNAGVFFFSNPIFDLLPERGSLESITLEKIALEGKLRAVRYSNALWRSVDSHKDVEEAEKEFEFMLPITREIGVRPELKF
jgi:mannose-1-phosphate guanylyltransferase